jgi:hypothetical protein
MVISATDQPGTISQGPSGATITTAYTGRVVKVVAVLDSELKTISSLNTRATIFLGVASGLIALAGGIWITAGFTPTSSLPPAGVVLMNLGAPVLVVLGLVFVALTCLEFRSKASLLENIQREQLHLSATKPET